MGHTPRQRIRDYAALARISNLPTCVSNTLVGAAIAQGLASGWRVILVALGVCLLYAAAMAMNDVVDAERDRAHNPHRPIPAQWISRRSAAVFAALAGLISAGIFATIGRSTGADTLLAVCGLVVCIVAYNVLHQRLVWAALLMGACRAGVYILAFVACTGTEQARDWATVLPLAACLLAYITGITLIARTEHLPSSPSHGWAGWLLGLPVLAAAVMISVPLTPPQWWIAAGTLLVTVIWLLHTARKSTRPNANRKVAIQSWIAGISLIDAYLLTIVAAPLSWTIVALGCFAATVAAQKRISGT